MRLVGPDTVLFAIGLFLFLGAGYALVQMDDGGEGGLNTYDVTWTTETAKATVVDGIGASASDSQTFTLTEGNLTKATFSFTCSDNHPLSSQAPVQFSADVTSPEGETKSMQGTCGDTITVSFDLAPMPDDTRVFSGSDDSASQKVARTYANSTGVGEWTINYETSRDDPTGVASGAGSASGSIEASYERYAPHVTYIPR